MKTPQNSHWLSNIFKIDIKEYIKGGEELLKKQKVVLVMNHEDMANLTLFLQKLKHIFNTYQRLDKFILFYRTKEGKKFVDDMVEIAPTKEKIKFKEHLRQWAK